MVYNKIQMPDNRTSICTRMNVMLPPAITNGYSHSDQYPSCLHKWPWENIYKISVDKKIRY